MGLLTGLLTLPLAPVRGTVWLAERLAEEAARELDDERSIQRQLIELQMSYDLGEIDDEEYAEAEADLLERLARAREATRQSEAESA
jgi:hypothetical protein